MELVIVPVAVISNFVRLSRGLVEGYFSGGIRTVTFIFAININGRISSCVIPRDCHVCPNVRRNVNATVKGVPLIATMGAMASKFDLPVMKTKMKLPWIIPVVINRFYDALYKASHWFYPTGNGKTPAIEIDYRSSGEGI